MIYVHLATGFEELEALTVVDVLRRASLDVKTVSLTREKEVTGRSDITVLADQWIGDTDYSLGEMIVLPGGQPGATHLLNHEELKERILQYHKERKYLAAICAAPMVLGAHGVLTGKKATIYPGMESHLRDGEYQDHKVVLDGHVITSQGPGTAMEFALTLVGIMAGEAMKDKVKKELLL